MTVLSRLSPASEKLPIESSQVQSQAFRLLLQGVAVVAGLIHVAFLSLFHWVHVDAMAIINVVSILAYVWCFMLARQGRVELCWTVTSLEVLVHAILAVGVIGWDSGFHYYILLVIPVAVISSIRPLWLKGATVTAVTAVYLALDVLVRHKAPPFQMPEAVLDGLHYFNVLGAIGILIFLAGYYYHLISKAEATLREIATTDPLTQLRNRRAVMEAIRDEEQRILRGQHGLSFVLCDLDHFKSINDTHGHDAGDQVLKAVSRALCEGIREVDHLARWGGEEFLLVLPGVTTREAGVVAERLREQIAALHIPLKDRTIQVSMTFGVSVWHEGESTEQTISRADVALYQGKHEGRNRVVLEEELREKDVATAGKAASA